MSLARQGASFVLVGMCLIAADWAMFVLLTSLGVPASIANFLGRVTGALLGFWANGRFTFGVDGTTGSGRRRFLRFLVSWIPLTMLSTVLVTAVAANLGLQMAWLAKPLVEGALAGIGFVVSRHWVYR